MSIVWPFFAFFLLLDLFLAILRAALLNARLPQLIELGSNDEQDFERTIKILEKPRLRATLRLVMGLSHAFVLVCSWMLFIETGVPFTFAGAVGFFVLMIMILMGMEYLVERFPLKNAEKWAIRLAPIGNVLDIVFTPLTSLLIIFQGTGTEVQRNLGSVTEDELKTWVEVGQPEGGLEPDERKMIYSIFQFGDTLCREIMVPRIEVLALDIKTPLNTAVNMMIESGHSRVPVYEDIIDNVVGMLYAKDLLRIQVSPNEKHSIRKFLRPAYFIPESKKVDELLAEMQSKGVHIAVVVDEFGGMAGLVSLEDIVEEIVGEIRDEYDQSEEILVQKVTDDEFVFMGRVSLADFNDALSTELESEQSDTLGGYFYSELGRVPVEGDHLQFDDWQLTVEEVRGRRVGRIRASRIDPNDETE